MQLKLPQKEQFKKTAEGTGNLINNKTADAVTKTYDGRITSLKNFTTEYFRDS